MGLMPRRHGVQQRQGDLPPAGRPAASSTCRRARVQHLRGAHLAMIFQDPMTALNPVRSIGDQLIEAVTAHAKLTRVAARDRAIELLTRVGIPAPERRMRDYPFQFSGGMLQRALIAIALASAPAAAAGRRADHLARRDHPGPDPQPAARTAAGHRDEHDPGQPRPRGDHRGMRPGDRDVRRARSSRKATTADDHHRALGIRTPRPCSRRCRRPSTAARCAAFPARRRA